MIKIGSDCAGVGAFPQSLKKLNINFTEEFACDFDYFARLTYCKNYGTEADLKLALSKEHKRYADKVKEIVLRDKTPSEKEIAFLNEANEFAKLFSFYFPFNMYQREIPKKPLDVYVGSFPCQSFSLAGKRKGEEDKRGILFYCGHEFIQKNKPRYFIIENVKGLMSDDGGKTFQRWIDYLGGKSVNGTQTMFPDENAVPYHVYYQVLNAKDYGVPQNRERIFIIGIRDDADNNFNFPKPFELKKRLKDVLEENVDEKYYLSEKMIDGFIGLNQNGIARTIRCGGGGSKDDKHNWDLLKVGYINQDTQASQVFSQESISQTLCAGTHGYANGYVEVKSATSKGYEIAEIGEDSINLEHPNSETRRGRVGKSVAQTLTTSCNQGVAIGAIRGRNPDNPKSRESGLPTQQMLEVNESGTSNCLTTVQKDNVVVEMNVSIIDDIYNNREERIFTEYSPTIRSERQGLKVTVGAISEPTIQQFDIKQEVKVRKNTVDIKGLQALLKSHKNKTIKQISEHLNRPKTEVEHWFRTDKSFSIPDEKIWYSLKELLSISTNDFDNQIMEFIYKDNEFESANRVYDSNGISPTITCVDGDKKIINDYRIRKLTVRECFRLMDFPDTFDFSVVSDSQAYKQAGNSIVVNVLAQIISKFNLT